MSDWTQPIETGFTKLGELAAKYGPPAVETAAHVIQINAVGSLVRAGLLTGAGIAVTLAAVGQYRAAEGRWKAESDRIEAFNADKRYPYTESIASDYEMYPIVFSGIGAICGALFASIAAFGLLDQWLWVALWNPKLALAAKIVNALPGIAQ